MTIDFCFAATVCTQQTILHFISAMVDEVEDCLLETNRRLIEKATQTGKVKAALAKIL